VGGNAGVAKKELGRQTDFAEGQATTNAPRTRGYAGEGEKAVLQHGKANSSAKGSPQNKDSPKKLMGTSGTVPLLIRMIRGSEGKAEDK